MVQVIIKFNSKLKKKRDSGAINILKILRLNKIGSNFVLRMITKCKKGSNITQKNYHIL